MHFDLTDLRLFLHVTEAASITHGAERAHLALASASARIRAMEESLGIALLVRERRGVRPTPAGLALIRHARAVLSQVENLRGELDGYAGGLKGQVRLCANTAAVTEFLPDALAPYLAANPNIDLDLEERSSYEIVQAVAAGFADIGIVSDAVDHAALETLPFRPDRLVLVVARGHRLARRRSAALRDVVAEPFIGLGQGSALGDYLDRHVANLGRRLRFRVRLRGFDAICRLVASGAGIAIMPETASRRHRRPDLRVLALSDPWASRTLLLCARSFATLAPPGARLVEKLRAH
jgi:DNA-binding transcriptional LysR family regulator